MNDDLTTLASAYLDGAITADERAQVEASEELLAEVDRLRAVRAVVSSSSSANPAPISMRERHLSSALDAWDRLPENERTGALRDSTPTGADGAAAAGMASITSPSRRPTKRRWAQSPGWLGAAAAGLVLVLAGGLVLQNTVGDDTDQNSSGETSGGTESSDQVSSADAARTAEGGEAGAEAPTAAADAVSESELEEATAAQAPTGTAPIENGSGVDTDLNAEAPPAEDGTLEQLNTTDDLAIFASDAIGAPASDDIPEGATVITDVPAAVLAEAADVLDALDLRLCQGADVVVGLALYGDERVVVGINVRRNVALAYREDDCSLVARASLS